MSNRRSLAIIFIIIFVNLLGFGIIIPLLPLYAQEFQANSLQIGLLFASYSLCQIVAAPLLGALSDRYGRRPILLVSLFGTVISFGMLGLLAIWGAFLSIGANKARKDENAITPPIVIGKHSSPS